MDFVHAANLAQPAIPELLKTSLDTWNWISIRATYILGHSRDLLSIHTCKWVLIWMEIKSILHHHGRPLEWYAFIDLSLPYIKSNEQLPSTKNMGIAIELQSAGMS